MSSLSEDWIWGEDRRRRRPPEAPPTPDLPPARPETRSDPFKPIKRQFAGTMSVVVAMLSGMVLTNSTMVEPVPSASGEALLISPPDSAFAWALGLLGVAIVLMMYATWHVGGGR